MRFQSKSLLKLTYSILLGVFFSTAAHGENLPLIKPGDTFPEVLLTLPAQSKGRAYLGVGDKETFFVSDIQADLILVEIMNINCPSCQRQAPIYNKLYSLIESSKETTGRIKMLAIGAGNRSEYIKEFQDHFKAPYPIIEDPEMVVYDAIGKSPVPFAILIRPGLEGRKGIVVQTHKGLKKDHESMYNEMKSLLKSDVAAILKKGGGVESKAVDVKPIFTDELLLKKIKEAFIKEGNSFSNIDKIKLDNYGVIYTGTGVKTGANSRETIRIFAKVVSEPPPCDQCHDIHFIYIFDETGKILQFVPIQLTKYGNKPWSDQDKDRMRKKIIGRSINKPFSFDAKVDAISSATITSLVIFNSLNDGQGLFEELKTKKLIDP